MQYICSQSITYIFKPIKTHNSTVLPFHAGLIRFSCCCLILQVTRKREGEAEPQGQGSDTGPAQ